MYNTIIDALGKSGRLQQMVQFHTDMQTNAVQPDVWTFASLIHAFGRAGDFPKMLRYVEELKTAFPKTQPDDIVYNIIVNSFGKQKQYDKVIYWYEQMRAAGFAPNTANYVHLIDAYRHKGDSLMVHQMATNLNKITMQFHHLKKPS